LSSSLRVEVLATVLLPGIPKAIEKLLPVGREQFHVRINGKGCRQEPRILAVAQDKVPRGGFFISRVIEGAGGHILTIGQLRDGQIKLQAGFQLGECIAKCFVRSEVESGTKYEHRPDQRPVFIEEVRFVSLGQALFGRDTKFLAAAPGLGGRYDARMLLLEDLAGITKFCGSQ